MTFPLKKSILRLGVSLRKKQLLYSLKRNERLLIKKISKRKLTYLSVKKLVDLTKRCNNIEKKSIQGIFIEAGCALGGSSILIASLKNTQRPLFIYDVFEMIPPPSESDTKDVHERYHTIVQGESKGIGGDKYYGYIDNLYDVVIQNFNTFGIIPEKESVKLIKGLVQETMSINQTIALAHIDVDWYEPVLTCLERIFPNLSIGGCIILDDYHDWGGCRKATDEYLKLIEGQYKTDDSTGAMVLTRIK